MYVLRRNFFNWIKDDELDEIRVNLSKQRNHPSYFCKQYFFHWTEIRFRFNFENEKMFPLPYFNNTQRLSFHMFLSVVIFTVFRDYCCRQIVDVLIPFKPLLRDFRDVVLSHYPLYTLIYTESAIFMLFSCLHCLREIPLFQFLKVIRHNCKH
jgi:hypothetical protein